MKPILTLKSWTEVPAQVLVMEIKHQAFMEGTFRIPGVDPRSDQQYALTEGESKYVLWLMSKEEDDLANLVAVGLTVAAENGLTSFVIPPLRTGDLVEVYPGTEDESIRALVDGVKRFFKDRRWHRVEVTIAVHGDEDLAERYRSQLK